LLNGGVKKLEELFPFFPNFFPLGKTRKHKGKADTPSATTRQQEKGVWGEEGEREIEGKEGSSAFSPHQVPMRQEERMFLNAARTLRQAR
jgi:hypothetical protein